MTSTSWMDDDEELLAMIKTAVAGRDLAIDETVDADRTVDRNDGAGAEPRTAQISDAAVARMRQAAKSAYTWRTIDQDLERLTMHSDSDLAAATQVRGAGAQPYRIVEFHGENLDLEMEIGEQALVGQVYPAQQGEVTLQTAGGTSMATSVDEVGCFTFARPVAGPFRLRCDIGATRVVTDWISLT